MSGIPPFQGSKQPDFVYPDWPRYGLAVWRGGGDWHVLSGHQGLSMTASPPLAMVRHPSDDGFNWDWPEVPECGLTRPTS